MRRALLVASLVVCSCDAAEPSCRVPGVVSHFDGSLTWISGTAPSSCGVGATPASVLLPDYYPFLAGVVEGCGVAFELDLVLGGAVVCTLQAQPTAVVRDGGRGSGGPLLMITARIEPGAPCAAIQGSADPASFAWTPQSGTVTLTPTTLDLVMTGESACLSNSYTEVAVHANRGTIDPPP
jgi:hypothetical protein